MPDVNGNGRPANGDALVTSIIRIGKDLATSFGEILRHVPGAPQRSHEFAEILGINKVLSHRLVNAVRKVDPLATAHLIPGPDPLRRVMNAAARKGVPPAVLRPAEAAVEAFDRLIRTEFGDRTGLDAIVGTRLPGVRTRIETLAKQSIYRGSRQLKGVAADLEFRTSIRHPGSDPLRCDHLWMDGFLGVRRVRPNATFSFGVTMRDRSPQTAGIDQEFHGLVLERFCANPPVGVEVRTCPEGVDYTLDWGDSVGLNSACDIVMADLFRNSIRRYRKAPDLTRGGVNLDVHVPCRRLIFDLLLHDELFPDCNPMLQTLQSGVHGAPRMNAPPQELEILDVAESVQPLGRRIENFRVEEIPNYVEMLELVCARAGWDPSRFRGYRCRIEYPIFGSYLQVSYQEPNRPAAG